MWRGKYDRSESLSYNVTLFNVFFITDFCRFLTPVERGSALRMHENAAVDVVYFSYYKSALVLYYMETKQLT